MGAELGGQAASRRAAAGDGAACGGYQRAPRAVSIAAGGGRQGGYIHEEIERMEVCAAQMITDTKQQLALLKLKGTARKEQGAVAPVILKRAPKRDGLLVVGSQVLDALDRFMLGSVSTKLIHHATCPVLVVKDEEAQLRRITLATDGSSASAQALRRRLAYRSSSKDRTPRLNRRSLRRLTCPNSSALFA